MISVICHDFRHGGLTIGTVIYEAGMTRMVTNDRNLALLFWRILKTNLRMGLTLFFVFSILNNVTFLSFVMISVTGV